jgi:ferredoxin
MAGRILVDRSLCDGNGVCAGQAPGYFMLDANDELQLLKEEVDEADLSAVERAIASCPKAALRVE